MNSFAANIHNFKITVSPWALLAVVCLGILVTGQDWASWGAPVYVIGLLDKIPAILTTAAAVFVTNEPIPKSGEDTISPTVSAY